MKTLRPTIAGSLRPLLLASAIPVWLAGQLAAAEVRSSDQAPPVRFPGAKWEEVSPELEGVDAAKLKAAVEYMDANFGREGAGELVIVRNGRLIWAGPDADAYHSIFSCTKTFTSAVLGLLVGDGKCALDDPAVKHVPELDDQYPLYGKIRLRHLASMCGGYHGEVKDKRTDQPWGDVMAYFNPREPYFEAGTHVQYNDHDVFILGKILTLLIREPLQDFFQRRIAGPIGMTRWEWGVSGTVDGIALNNPPGNPGGTGAGGIKITPREFARFGLLMLNRGNWNGRQLLNASYVDAATANQIPVDWGFRNRDFRGKYGYYWWVNGVLVNGKRSWPSAPPKTYYVNGAGANFCVVVPEWNLVLVRMGSPSSVKDPVWDTFFGKLADAVSSPGGSQAGRPARETRLWQPLTLDFHGPATEQSASDPNPFLDYRLQVRFTGPSGRNYSVPGYFDGDGQGGSQGDVWRVRFSPDEPGQWRYVVSFRKGKAVAVALDPVAGSPSSFDGAAGSVQVGPADQSGGDFYKWGRLEYVSGHYLKFRNGPYWIKGGTDEPEDFLAYAGFDHTLPSHRYAEHIADWRLGDPDWGNGRGRGIIGALNYLASKHVNSLYFLTMNIGGDGCNVWPWAGSPNPKGDPANDHLHLDLAKLRQWETVFAHAQRRGINLHFVLNEAEKANKRELDDGELGMERKLYYREIVARFAHHLALEWNLCEEYNIDFDLGADRVRQFADYLRAVDPYGHPITVHSAKDPLEALQFTFGDPRFSMTSIQLGQARIDTLTEQFRRETAKAGRPLPVSMDEFTLDRGQERAWDPVDDAERWRREKLWPTYLSGGNIEFILEHLLAVESFKTPERDRLWDYVWFARRFLEALPFWEMAPADELLRGEGGIKLTAKIQRAGKFARETYEMGGQVFAKPGEVYAVYLPTASTTGTLDLSADGGRFRLRWYNPRSGQFVGEARPLIGGVAVSLGAPPVDPEKDWAISIEREGR